jgi:hypothetical protein
MNKPDQHTRALILKSEIDPHHRVPLYVGLLTLERSKTADEEISAKVKRSSTSSTELMPSWPKLLLRMSIVRIVL